ncbi:MAG: cytochrome b [Pseudomonadota bacterium]
MTVNFKNTKASYGIVSITLHWIMAALLIGLFALGTYMVDLNYYDQWYVSFPWWHKSIGISVFSLLFIRSGWMLSNATPASLKTYKAWEMQLAKTVHILFYILILIICISGYFISTAKGVGIEVFGWFDVPALINIEDQQADIAGEIHEISNYALFILFSLHAIAALKHHFINKDITLTRILKPTKPKENIE